MNEIEIRPFVAPAFGQNAYILRRLGRADAIIVDPGGQHAALRTALAGLGLETAAILLTHAHIDHVEGVPAIHEATGAPIWLHPADRPLYDRAAQQAAMFGLRVGALPEPEHELRHGQVLDLAGLGLEVRHVPGHSPGHVILYIAEAGAAMVGDVIFQGSIGRTDLPGGDFAQLIRNIREQVFSLPAETELYTGHGPSTTVGHEQMTNPFLIPQYGGGLA
jgi:glyoxylase-like metal-dependent hydrolase (beta-lactamase superfamily II)